MSIFSGKLFLLIGPSGVGKGTVINELRKKHSDWVFPVSVTTRKKRPGEKEGITYYFYDQTRFEEEIKSGDFLEWACVHKKQYYGLLKKTVFDALRKRKTIIREIDIQGFESTRKIIPKRNLVSIFLLPPNIELLIKRITERSPLSPEEIKERMRSANIELSRASECDYQVQTIDKMVTKAVLDVERIIMHETKA